MRKRKRYFIIFYTGLDNTGASVSNISLEVIGFLNKHKTEEYIIKTYNKTAVVINNFIEVTKEESEAWAKI